MADGAARPGDRPLGVLPPRLVPLDAEHERQAVDALANLLAPLLAEHSGLCGDANSQDRSDNRPDDGQAA